MAFLLYHHRLQPVTTWCHTLPRAGWPGDELTGVVPSGNKGCLVFVPAFFVNFLSDWGVLVKEPVLATPEVTRHGDSGCALRQVQGRARPTGNTST